MKENFLKLLNNYVNASAAWNRSINMRLSKKTQRARGQKAEAAFRELETALKRLEEK